MFHARQSSFPTPGPALSRPALTTFLVLASAAVITAAAPMAGSGIIHFYEPKVADRPLEDVQDPLIVGAEAIFWWGDLEPQEGRFNWSRVDRELDRWNAAGKPLDIRLGTAHIAPNHTPAWLFDQYHVRRIGRGHWADFEEEAGIYTPGPRGRRTEHPDEVITGKASIATRAEASDSEILLRMVRPDVFAPNSRYSLQFDYRSTTGATGSVALVRASGEPLQHAEFYAPPVRRGSFSFPFTTDDAADAQLWWGVMGDGQLSLDNINLMPIVNLPPLRYDSVEHGLRYWTLTDMASVTHDTSLVLTGKASLVLSNQLPGYAVGVLNDPVSFPILRGQGYSASYAFKALTSVTLKLRLMSHAAPYDVLDEQVITLKQGDTGTQRWHYPAFVWRDETRLEIGVVGPGVVVIDDLRWNRWSDRVTCFPDYFNPVFRDKWERFITAFADRYAEHPGLGRVSVGGFGRWEEVILDDDVPGLLDAQWLARGFSTERYLDHIAWSMDLFQRLFPAKPLRVCLAYGLKRQNDQDLMYRRVAQAAVARGIGLKQNGLSEKYGSWDEVTSAPYLFNRYRFTPGISLTYETGGQIARVSRHYAQGHPLSVLHRSAIDGTHFQFLYGSDIHSRHVHKYLGYTSDLLGAPLLTTFYSRLGDFSLVMEHSPAPQEYRNQWLGLREYTTDGADPLLTFRAGQPCAATRDGHPHIVFDLDDRQQYHGMHGVVFTVEYLDEGTDEFEVNVFHQMDRAWRKLGHVRKTGSGEWKQASFMKPDWCRSPRGDGEDVHADVVINDLGDGIEYIAGVSLSFVPAREWQRELIQASEPTRNHRVLEGTLTRDLTLPPGTPLHWIAVRVWNGGWQRSGLRGRITALTPDGPQVVSEKDYPMPADGDWFELPLTPAAGCEHYRIELSHPVGQVGVYLDADGEAAFRAWRYATAPTTDGAASPVLAPSGPLPTEIEFQAHAPFVGLQWSSAGQATSGWHVQVQRQLGEGNWSMPLTRQVLPWDAVPGASVVWFEPQTPGHYKLVLLPSEQADSASAPVALTDVKVMELVRLRPPHPNRQLEPLSGEVLFDPAQVPEPAETWRGLILKTTQPSHVTLEIARARPLMDVTVPVPFEALPGDVLRFQLANRSGAPMLRVLWAGPGKALNGVRSALVPLVQNDAVLRDNEFVLGHEDHWRGPVAQLRFELLNADPGGELDLGQIQLLRAVRPASGPAPALEPGGGTNYRGRRR